MRNIEKGIIAVRWLGFRASLNVFNIVLLLCSYPYISSCTNTLNYEEDPFFTISDMPRFSCRYLLNLKDFGVAPFSKNAQGMDTYQDKLLFQTGVDDTNIHVLDLATLSCLRTFPFVSPAGESSHMNNINCGEKYYYDDSFPLLYISQTSHSHSCFVIRLSNYDTSYELLQTIQYIGHQHHANSNYDWFIDINNRYIYTYGKFNQLVEDREIVKFHLPSLNRSKVLLTDEDVIDSFVLSKMSIYQGSRIIDGLLYAPVGYGNDNYPEYLKVIDLNRKQVIEEISLDCGEPEAIGPYRDGAIISTGGRSPKYYYIQLR